MPNRLNETEWVVSATQSSQLDITYNLKLIIIIYKLKPLTVKNRILQPDTVYEIDLDLIPVLGALKEFYSAKKVLIKSLYMILSIICFEG